MTKQGLGKRAAVMALLLALAALVGPTATTVAAEPVSAGQADVTAEGAVSLLELRVDTGGTTPVITLDGSGPMRHESFLLDKPDRLVVDLPGVINRVERQRFTVLDHGLVQVRVAQFQLEPVPVTRVVLDLEAPLAHVVSAEGSGLSISFDESAGQLSAAGPGELPDWAAQPQVADEPPAVAEVAVIDEVEETGRTEETEEFVEVAEVAEVAEEVTKPEETADPVTALLDGIEEEAAQPDDTVEVVDEAPAEPVTLAVAEPVTPAVAEPVTEPAAPAEAGSRSIDADAMEELLSAPQLAAEASQELAPASTSGFETRTISTGTTTYTGKRISLNLVDANIKEVFRLFHEISGINFVLDPSVEGRVTIVVDNVPWDQALDLILKNNGLDKVIENNVIRIASTEKLANEAAQRKALKEAKELEVEPITITRTLSYAKAKDVERVIREGGVLSQRGKVIVDERTNTLIISDIPKKVDPLDQLISTLDSETPQVMIEARVVETSRSFTRDLGIVWGFSAIADASRGTQTGLPFPSNASVQYGLNLPGTGTASNLAFKFGNIIDSFTLDIALNTLETEGRGRILSSPKIATQNNERAEIEQGVRIPIVNTTATEINVEFVSASLRMEVTPQITAEGTIILDVIVENNSPDFVNTVGEGVPPINTQRAQTKVLIEDGGTTVIGGIFVVNEGESEVGVPWFRKIPVFGWLFKNSSINRENRELLIFITPKIMKLG